MCFGATHSIVSLCILLGAGVVGWMQGVDSRLYLTCFFLAIKEWLQWQSYREPGCTPWNLHLSELSWLHISLQPFFVNLFLSALAPTTVAREYRVILVLCILFAIANLLRLDTIRSRMGWSTVWCTPNRPQNLCREKTCSRPGRHHLAYGFRLASADAHSSIPSSFTYSLLSFAPGLILGPRHWTAVHILVALVSAFLIAPHDAGEAGAIWCLNSSWIGWVTLGHAFFSRT